MADNTPHTAQQVAKLQEQGEAAARQARLLEMVMPVMERALTQSTAHGGLKAACELLASITTTCAAAVADAYDHPRKAVTGRIAVLMLSFDAHIQSPRTPDPKAPTHG
jgi:hypothetical protein